MPFVKARRKPKDVRSFSARKLREICLSMKSIRDRCLMAMLYLSGRRISEIIGLLRKDVEITEDHHLKINTLNLKTYRSIKTGNYRILRGSRYYEEIQIEFSLTSKTGKLLGEFITDHIEYLWEEGYIFQRSRGGRGHINRHRAYQIIAGSHPDLWPHLLRHQRFTDIAPVFKDDPLAMHQFTKHKRFETTMQYIRKAELEEKLEQI